MVHKLGVGQLSSKMCTHPNYDLRSCLSVPIAVTKEGIGGTLGTGAIAVKVTYYQDLSVREKRVLKNPGLSGLRSYAVGARR